jgi:hypothetical protein
MAQNSIENKISAVGDKDEERSWGSVTVSLRCN